MALRGRVAKQKIADKFGKDTIGKRETIDGSHVFKVVKYGLMIGSGRTWAEAIRDAELNLGDMPTSEEVEKLFGE
jgi:hypothetical protein